MTERLTSTLERPPVFDQPEQLNIAGRLPTALTTHAFRGDLTGASTEEQFQVARELQGNHDHSGIWTSEQELAIKFFKKEEAGAPNDDWKQNGMWTSEQVTAFERLKTPVSRSPQGPNKFGSRLHNIAEKHKISGEKAKILVGNLGHIAVKAGVKLGDAAVTVKRNIQPKLRSASKATLQHTARAIERGAELDARMLDPFLRVERKIGGLVLSEIQKRDLVEKGKKASIHAKNQAQKIKKPFRKK